MDVIAMQNKLSHRWRNVVIAARMLGIIDEDSGEILDQHKFNVLFELFDAAQDGGIMYEAQKGKA